MLSENRLVRLSGLSFHALTLLKKLSLARNRLTDLPAGLFSGLSSLQELDLSANKLHVISHTTFKDLADLRNLSLRHNRLETLDAGSFLECKQLESLDLTGNQLVELRPGCFYGLASIGEILLADNKITVVDEHVWQQVSTVRTIDLSRNNLGRLSVKTFGALKRVQTLLLANNNLLYIENQALDGLTELERLDLSSNRLSDALLSSSQGVFSRLAQLKVLDLRNNSINSLQRKLFHGLTELQRVFLDGNPITTVERDAFGGLSRLVVLQMNSEKLVCDCKLAWLPAWLKEASFFSSVTGTCQEPSLLRGRSLQLVPPSDFTCDAANQYSVPNITLAPAPVTKVLRGSAAELTCQAVSLGQIRSTGAFWRRNAEVVHNGSNTQVEAHARTDDALASSFTIVLRIKNVTDEDEARYQCGFVNEYGIAYSHEVDLKVLVFPQFSVLPANVKAKADQDVSIRCAATGQPVPEISIQKQKDSFPSARDRRFSFNQETNEFIIKKVRAEDAGVYHCVAKNDAGTSIANATVEVLEPPHFVNTLQCPVGRRGRMTVLECSVDGMPRPTIVWQHEGTVLMSSEGTVLMSSEQHVFALTRLILADTRPSDAGRYTCLASNILGKVESSCDLVVSLEDALPPGAAAPAGSVAPGGGGAGSGGGDQTAASSAPWLDSTITGVIVISVVACVVGTSLIWVVIIYHTRKTKHRCMGGGGGAADSSSSHTDDTLVPLPLSCAGSSGTNASAGGDDACVPPGGSGPGRRQLPPSHFAAVGSEQSPTARWCLAVSRTNQPGGLHSSDGLFADVDLIKKGQTLPFARGRSKWQQRWDWDCRAGDGNPYDGAALGSLLAAGGSAADRLPAEDDVFVGSVVTASAACGSTEDVEHASGLSWQCSFGTFQPPVAASDRGSKNGPPSRSSCNQSSRLMSM